MAYAIEQGELLMQAIRLIATEQIAGAVAEGGGRPLHAPGLFLACETTAPPGLGPRDGGLAPCGKPNCVNTQERGESWTLDGPPDALWSRIRRAVEGLPRTVVAADQPGRYLHAEARSRVFRFVDDLEVYVTPSGTGLAVRSAARVGYWDLGVNGRRVRRLRNILVRQSVIADS